MKLLGTLAKYSFYLLLLALLALLLTVLSWWMRWPLFTGLALMLGSAGLVLFALVLRKLWAWRSKKQFVRAVLAEQQPHQAGMRGSSLRTAWQAGMDVLRQSPLRFKKDVAQAQPWYLTLDDTDALSPLFCSAARSVPPHKEQPALCWYYFPSSVLLHTACLPQKHLTDAAAGDADWEDMLTLLAEHKNVPFHGLLLLLSARTLAEEGTETARQRALRLRDTVRQIMLTLDRQIPVYVLLQDFSSMDGMGDLLSRLPAACRDMRLGHVFSAQPESAGAGILACRDAARQLRGQMDQLAAQGDFPRSHDLHALAALEMLGEKLDVLLQSLCGEMPHQLRPLLRGVFFAECPQKDISLSDSTAAADSPFLHGFIAGVLPETRRPVPPLNSRFSLQASTRALCLGAWLLLTLGLCGLMAVTTIYQSNVLRHELNVQRENLSHSARMNALYGQLTVINTLEKARGAWFLPVIGKDALQYALAELKAKYVSNVFAQLLRPMMQRNNAIIQNAHATQEQNNDAMKEIYWLTSILMDKIDGDIPFNSQFSSNFPLTSSNKQTWTALDGTVISSAIQWTEDKKSLELTQQILQNLLSDVINKDTNILERWFTIFDEKNRNFRKCLSDYWTYLPKDSEKDMCIQPHFTKHGYLYFNDFVKDINSILGNNSETNQHLNKIVQRYLKEYAEAWRQFISQFDKGWRGNMNSKQYTEFYTIKDITTLPHMRLLQDLGKELTPLQRGDASAPRWTADILLLQSMSTVAQAGENKENSFWVTLLNMLSSSPETLQTLRAHSSSAAQLQDILRSTEALHNYFLNVCLVLRQITNPPDALALAQQLYSKKRAADTQENSYDKAATLLNDVTSHIGGKDSPASKLLAGMVQFAGHGAVIQGGNELQDIWDTEVLGSPAYLYQKDDRDALYGEKGVVSAFVNAHLTPFLNRTAQGMAVKSWDDTPFPFTEDFVTSLSRAENMAAAPAQESYSLLLRSSPTLVNIDASLRPDSTVITADGGQQLVNRNYPKQAQFTYKPREAGAATLEIRFPAFILRRTYSNLVDLISDFSSGEHTFVPEDFPDAQKRLESATVKEITVRLIADNAAPLLQQLALEIPVVQDRITFTW